MKTISPFLLLAVCLLQGCSSDSATRTAVQLVLTPDQSSSPVADLLADVGRIEVIVDADGGLDGVSEAGDRAGGGVAVDWDDDGELEVRFEVKPLDPKTLPVLEVGLENNAGRDLVFRVFGYGSDSAAATVSAAGGVLARVESGQVRRVGTPFNLAPWARPPRVLLVLPPDGATLPGGVSGITAVLSTAIDPQTLAGNVRFRDPQGVPREISVHDEIAVVSDGAFGKQQRTLLTIEIGGLPQPGEYRVEIGPGIESASGRLFDQDPATPAADGFTSRLRHDGPAVGGGGHPCDYCPEGYWCHDDFAGCVPMPSCATGCPDNYVCDETQKQCVEDCRRSDLCFVAGKQCDADSGFCK